MCPQRPSLECRLETMTTDMLPLVMLCFIRPLILSFGSKLKDEKQRVTLHGKLEILCYSPHMTT